jgi:hypothetical protein
MTIADQTSLDRKDDNVKIGRALGGQVQKQQGNDERSNNQSAIAPIWSSN